MERDKTPDAQKPHRWEAILRMKTGMVSSHGPWPYKVVAEHVYPGARLII